MCVCVWGGAYWWKDRSTDVEGQAHRGKEYRSGVTAVCPPVCSARFLTLARMVSSRAVTYIMAIFIAGYVLRSLLMYCKYLSDNNSVCQWTSRHNEATKHSNNSLQVFAGISMQTDMIIPPS